MHCGSSHWYWDGRFCLYTSDRTILVQSGEHFENFVRRGYFPTDGVRIGDHTSIVYLKKEGLKRLTKGLG